MDLKEIKQKFGDRVCLIGNVNCGLLQTGTEEACAEDVRRSLREGMPGYGYIFPRPTASTLAWTCQDMS
ncbi:MAG: uroporphyrinogen decarboxylase family protein [Clostridia bacterium]